MTFTIINSNIDDSKNGGEDMSSIDLVILGIVMEKPQSAYDIQKDVEYFQDGQRLASHPFIGKCFK